MSSSKWHCVAGIFLLASLGSVTGSMGQVPGMRRLPPTQRIPSSTQVRTQRAIQANALLAAGDEREPPFAGVVAEPAEADKPLGDPLPETVRLPEHSHMLPEEYLTGAGTWMEEYAIQPGDELEVKFRFTQNLNEQVTVRPDGMISLQVVGDVMAANQTSEELRQSLMGAYRTTLKDPALVVIVRRFAGNHVFVGGEVQAPGRINISGQITALQAIILAGGFKDTSDKKRVILRRDDGWREQLNLKAEVHGRVVGYDVLLRPYDVIYVPKSPIAKVNLFVEQYIEKVLPFHRNAGVFVTRNIGN